MSLRRVIRDFMAPAEDPRRAFPDASGRQLELLASLRHALATIACSKSQLDAGVAQTRVRLARLEQQAREALRAGRTELARRALTHRELVAAELAHLERRLEQIDREEQRLSLAEQQLTARIEAFAARERLVSARYSAAETQVRINEALTGVSQELAGLVPSLEQAEEHTEQLEARAAALEQLVALGGLDGDGTSCGLDGAEVAQAVERRLAELVRETVPDLRGGPAQPPS